MVKQMVLLASANLPTDLRTRTRIVCVSAIIAGDLFGDHARISLWRSMLCRRDMHAAIVRVKVLSYRRQEAHASAKLGGRVPCNRWSGGGGCEHQIDPPACSLLAANYFYFFSLVTKKT